MASLSEIKEGNRKGWKIQFRDLAQRKKVIWLGPLPKRTAAKWKTNVEELLRSKANGERPDPPLAAWMAGLDPKLRNKLAHVGVIEGTVDASAPRTLGELLAEYQATRKSLATRSKIGFQQAADCLNRHFGAGRKLAAFTPTDGLEFREWCLTEGRKTGRGKSTGLSEATTRKHCQRARQIFAYAIKRKLVNENPFMGIPTSAIDNPERSHFIATETALKAIEHAPNAQWRAIIALGRFGGLRIPSELTALRWADVDFANRRLTIRAPKTGTRVCPIFPELLPYLEDLATLAQPGIETPLSALVLPSCADQEKNLRTHLHRILDRAGIEHWPRAFHNMRASRQTELLARFPAKDVCDWLGNSQAIAMKHYAMATSESFERAIAAPSGGSAGGSAGGSINAPSTDIQESSPVDQETKEFLVLNGKQRPLMTVDNSSTSSHCPRQESNLVYDLRRVACNPEHFEDEARA